MAHHQTPLLVFINLSMLLIMYILMGKAFRYPYVARKSNVGIFKLLCFCFVLFSFWGLDWFYYRDLYPELVLGNEGHMESVYVFIAQKVSCGYITFRAVIWGIGLLLVFSIINRMPISSSLALGIFGLVYLIWFSYARVSLAMALAYWGLLMLYSPSKSRLTAYLLGAMAIISAFYFHKSSLFAVGMVILAWITGKMNRKSFLFFMFVVVLVGVFLLPKFFTIFMSQDSSAVDGVLGKGIEYGQHYMGINTNRFGPGALIQNALERIPYYLLAWQCYKIQFSNKSYNIPKNIMLFMRLFLYIVIFSTLFLFNSNLNMMVVYERFLRFAAIPATIILAYFWENKFYPNLTKFTLYMAIFSTIYAVVYAMYCCM